MVRQLIVVVGLGQTRTYILDGNLSADDAFDTPADYSEWLERAVTAISQNRDTRPDVITVVVPTGITAQNEIIGNGGAFTSWDGARIASDLQKACGIPTAVCDAARALLLSEQELGEERLSTVVWDMGITVDVAGLSFTLPLGHFGAGGQRLWRPCNCRTRHCVTAHLGGAMLTEFVGGDLRNIDRATWLAHIEQLVIWVIQPLVLMRPGQTIVLGGSIVDFMAAGHDGMTAIDVAETTSAILRQEWGERPTGSYPTIRLPERHNSLAYGGALWIR
jgi:hypothetical protein